MKADNLPDLLEEDEILECSDKSHKENFIQVKDRKIRKHLLHQKCSEEFDSGEFFVMKDLADKEAEIRGGDIQKKRGGAYVDELCKLNVRRSSTQTKFDSAEYFVTMEMLQSLVEDGSITKEEYERGVESCKKRFEASKVRPA